MIIYDPAKMLRRIAPRSKIKNLLKGNVSLKKTALSFTDQIDFIDKKSVRDVALKTIRGYKERIAKLDLEKDQAAGDELKSAILADPKQLIQRVQNEVVFQIHQGIKEKYTGNIGVWLPSSAAEPRPEHQLNYGKQYIIGEGINGVEPGDEYGCQCGVEIQTDDTKLEL